MVAIIMAAGFSTRFGDNKLLMEINGRPIIKCVIDAVAKCGFDEVLLVYRSEEVIRTIENRGIRTVHNPQAGLGISTSVKAGVTAASETDAYMFFQGDQPFIDETVIRALQEAYYDRKGLIIAPKYQEKRGSPVIFDACFKNDLMAITGDTGGKPVIMANPDKLYEVPVENLAAGMDIDTLEDYKKYGGGN